MGIATERSKVIDIYAEAAEKKWVIPTFCSENLTTTEAILSAVKEYGEKIGVADLPITIAMTNLYSHRSQSTQYTHTKNWKIGLKLFLADLGVLTDRDSPFSKINVMTHLDHIQPEDDIDLLGWDMKKFSSIMFDASTFPWQENLERTARFVEENKNDIVIEGACDEIIDAEGNDVNKLTSPDTASTYIKKTGVDFIVSNLGTEHRASSADLQYHGDLAREISKVIGPKQVLHGTSSVSQEQISNLYNDGVCKVNIWTTLERDSSPALFEDMIINAAKVIGTAKAKALFNSAYLGKKVDLESRASLDYFTTVYRQDIIFNEIKKNVTSYLELFYTTA